MFEANRRQLLKAGIAGAAVLAAPSILRAQDAPVKIGVLLAGSGPYALQSEAATLAINIAVDQAGKKVLGRPIELVRYDDAQPVDAQQNYRKLVEQDKVSAVIGGSYSSSGLAIAAVASQLKVPTVITGAVATDITGKTCDRYVFRVNGPVQAYARMVARNLLTIGKKWYFLAGAYAYGQDGYAALKQELVAAGGTDLGMDSIPVGTADFSSIILKIRRANPEVVALVIGGSDLAAFLKQYNEFGLAGKIPVAALAVNDDEVWSQDKPTGLIGKFWHFNNPINSDAEHGLNDAVMKATGKPATQSHAIAWCGMRTLLAGIEQAKSLESEAICSALETVHAPGVPGYFRKWDHQFITPLALTKVRAVITNKYDPLEVVSKPMTPDQVEALFDTREQSQCKMGA